MYQQVAEIMRRAGVNAVLGFLVTALIGECEKNTAAALKNPKLAGIFEDDSKHQQARIRVLRTALSELQDLDVTYRQPDLTRK